MAEQRQAGAIDAGPARLGVAREGETSPSHRPHDRTALQWPTQHATRRMVSTLSRSRGTASVVMLVIGAVLLIAGTVAFYAREQIVDREAFANRAVEALEDDGVRTVVGREIVDLPGRARLGRPRRGAAAARVGRRHADPDGAVPAHLPRAPRSRPTGSSSSASGRTSPRSRRRRPDRRVRPEVGFAEARESAAGRPQAGPAVAWRQRVRRHDAANRGPGPSLRHRPSAARRPAAGRGRGRGARSPHSRAPRRGGGRRGGGALAGRSAGTRARTLAGVYGEDEVTDEEVRAAVSGLFDAFLGDLLTWALLLALLGVAVAAAAAALDPEDVEAPAQRMRRLAQRPIRAGRARCAASLRSPRASSRCSTPRSRCRSGPSWWARSSCSSACPNCCCCLPVLGRRGPRRSTRAAARSSAPGRPACWWWGRSSRSSSWSRAAHPSRASLSRGPARQVQRLVRALRPAPERGRLGRHAQLVLGSRQPRLVHRQPAPRHQAPARGRHPAVPNRSALGRRDRQRQGPHRLRRREARPQSRGQEPATRGAGVGGAARRAPRRRRGQQASARSGSATACASSARPRWSTRWWRSGSSSRRTAARS